MENFTSRAESSRSRYKNKVGNGRGEKRRGEEVGKFSNFNSRPGKRRTEKTKLLPSTDERKIENVSRVI